MHLCHHKFQKLILVWTFRYRESKKKKKNWIVSWVLLAPLLLTFLSGEDASLALSILSRRMFSFSEDGGSAWRAVAESRAGWRRMGVPPGAWSTAPYSLASVSGTLIPLCQTNHIHTVLGSRPIVSFPVYQAPILCHRIRSWLCKFFRGRVGMELRGPSEPHRSSFWLWPFLGGSQASVLDTVCSLISWNRT